MSGGPANMPKAEPGSSDQDARQKHQALFVTIAREMDQPKLRPFRTMAGACLPRGKLTEAEDTVALLDALEKENWISVGNYENLRILLNEAKLKQLSRKLPQAQKEVGKPKSINESKLCHCKLYVYLHDHLTEGMTEYESFIAITRTCLNHGTMAKWRNNILDILDVLETEGWIDCGNYENLITILQDAGILLAAEEIKKRQEVIRKATKKENPEEQLPECTQISERDRHHYKLYEHVNRSLTKTMTEYNSFMIIAKGYLDAGRLKETIKSIVDVLCRLETAGKIGVGNYDNLMSILNGAHLFKLESEVRERADRLPTEAAP